MSMFTHTTTIIERQIDSQTMRYKARKREYTVWLLYVSQGNWNMYWCPDCRQPIAQYKGDLVMEHPGIDEDLSSIKAKSPPLLIQCKNPDCGRKVMFVGMVYRNE